MPEYTYITDKIFTAADFFTAEECAAAIALAESLGFADAPVNSSLGPQIRKDMRNNTRVMLDDAAWANNLWMRIGDYIPKPVGAWSAC